MTVENREHPRLPYVDLVTLITPKERTYSSQSENVSLSGIFLVKEDPLPAGTQGLLSMRINTGEIKKIISSKFRVVHNGPSQDGLAGMGIEFIGMSEEDKTALKEVIEKIENE
jgi:c-di-GMP-binding flagellar brake protein YcgR